MSVDDDDDDDDDDVPEGITVCFCHSAAKNEVSEVAAAAHRQAGKRLT